MVKHAHGSLAQVRNIQRIVTKASGLPSPSSKLVGGIWKNFCPSCGSTDGLSGEYPWVCSCGWEAASQPDGCCRRINCIRKYGNKYALPLYEDMDIDNDKKLTPASKNTLKNAVADSIELTQDDLGEEVED